MSFIKKKRFFQDDRHTFNLTYMVSTTRRITYKGLLAIYPYRLVFSGKNLSEYKNL